MHETTDRYDVIIRPDAKPSLVRRYSKVVVKLGSDELETKDINGSQLDIDATYVDQEVQTIHRLTQIKNNKLGKAKQVKTTRDQLTPVQWDTIRCIQ